MIIAKSDLFRHWFAFLCIWMLINGFMHSGAHFFMCSMTLFFRHLLHNRVALPFGNCLTDVVVFCSVGHFDLSPTFLPRKWKWKISGNLKNICLKQKCKWSIPRNSFPVAVLQNISQQFPLIVIDSQVISIYVHTYVHAWWYDYSSVKKGDIARVR